MRIGVIRFAAFFTAICVLCGCSADDAAQDTDASAADATIDATAPGCLSLDDLCAMELPGVPCPSSLDIADDAGTWNGNGSCTLYQSTNMCGGNDVSEAGVIIDAGDILLDIAETHTGLLVFYDSSTRQLVGAASFENQVQQQCWGVIPPTYCAEITDGAACCDWSTGVLFQSFDAGVCKLLPGGNSSTVDAGDASTGD
jgi:hypothetical protein